MKLPRGFAKNYFSLNAIVATVNGVTMHRNATRVQQFHIASSSFVEDDEAKELEDLEELPCEAILSFKKECYCSYLFSLHTFRSLKLFISQNRFDEIYLFLNSVTSPPPRFLIKY